MLTHDWPTQLAQFLAEREVMPFAWGSNDCVTFAAAWVELATGREVFSAEHDSALSAAREIEKRGGLLAAVTDALGEPIDANSAQRGDIALIDMGGRDALGVVQGIYVAGPSEAGLLLVGRETIKAAWRLNA